MQLGGKSRVAPALLAGIWSAWLAGSAQALVWVGPWEPLRQGVDRAVGIADRNEPRAQVVNALRINLRDPAVQLLATPPNGSGPLETTSQTASQFLIEHGLEAAVNTSFYTPCCSSMSEPKDLIGLAIADGILVSPAQSEARAALLLTGSNAARFLNTVDEPLDTRDVLIAFAGSNFVLGNRNDLPTSPDNIFPGRTLAGLADDTLGDNRYMILVTIDAGRPGTSEGASRAESAAWLQRFGAHTGINLDGGGSTTMVIADGTGGWTLLNRPNGGTSQRYNGNHLGVFAPPSSEPPPPSFVTKWLVGIRNSDVGEFSPESGTANDLPGNPNGLDDDYYFSGTYGSPVGTLLTDEPAHFLERAVILFNPPNDATLRFHFNLTPEEAHSLNMFRYTTRAYQQDGDGVKQCSLEVLFNDIPVDNVALTSGEDYRSAEFSAAMGHAIAGENILTARQTGGTARWTSFDFHQLEIKVQPPLLRIQRLATHQISLAWTTNMAGFALAITADPGLPESWLTLTNQPVLSGRDFMVTLASENRAAFFRLWRSREGSSGGVGM